MGRNVATATTFAYGTTALIFCMSLVGVVYPALYVRETANWAAQAVGQDWVDLLLAVPWLAVTATMARRGSRAGVLLLAGGLGYAIYELVIYAFAIHFNSLFLVYCAALGLSVGGFLVLVHALLHEDVRAWFAESTNVRGAGSLLVLVGVAFTLLWLSEIVPAVARGGVPASLAEAGLATNPVHALDLSLVLPLHVLGGLLLLRRHPLGYLAAPVLLGFGVLMSASIGGMVLVMFLRGIAADATVVYAMGVLCVLTALFLTRLLRSLR
jgi:hypothetical protein